MVRRDIVELLSGEILEDKREVTLAELCRTARLPAEYVIELVEHGIIEPAGREPSVWHFEGLCVRRVRRVRRLQRDLGVNLAGAALALDLLEEMDRLHERIRRLEE